MQRPSQVAIDVPGGAGTAHDGVRDVAKALSTADPPPRESDELSLADDDLSDDSDGLSLAARVPTRVTSRPHASQAPPAAAAPDSASPSAAGSRAADRRGGQALAMRLLASRGTELGPTSSLSALWAAHSTKVVLGVACFFVIAITLATAYGASSSNASPGDSIVKSVRSLAEVYVKASANGVRLDDNGGASVNLADKAAGAQSPEAAATSVGRSALGGGAVGATGESGAAGAQGPAPVPLHALVEDHASPHATLEGAAPAPPLSEAERGSRQVAGSAKIEDTAAYPRSLSSGERERRDSIRKRQHQETTQQIAALKVEAAVMKERNSMLRASIASLAHTIRNTDLRPALIYQGHIPGVKTAAAATAEATPSTFTSGGAPSATATVVRRGSARAGLHPAVVSDALPAAAAVAADEPEDIPANPNHVAQTTVQPAQLMRDLLDAQNPNDLVDRVAPPTEAHVASPPLRTPPEPNALGGKSGPAAASPHAKVLPDVPAGMDVATHALPGHGL